MPAIDTPRASYVAFYDGIDQKSAHRLMRVVTEVLERERPETLHLLLSSKGGSVDAGMTLHTFLTALPVKVVTWNMGIVNSIGVVVFLAGAERMAAAHSTFLFHGVVANFPRGATVTLTQMQERMSALTEDENRVVRVIRERTAITEEEGRRFFHQGEVKDAQFAVQKGIVNAIASPQLPRGAKLHLVGHTAPEPA